MMENLNYHTEQPNTEDNLLTISESEQRLLGLAEHQKDEFLLMISVARREAFSKLDPDLITVLEKHGKNENDIFGRLFVVETKLATVAYRSGNKSMEISDVLLKTYLDAAKKYVANHSQLEGQSKYAAYGDSSKFFGPEDILEFDWTGLEKQSDQANS
jgi:hypothetical protein